MAFFSNNRTKRKAELIERIALLSRRIDNMRAHIDAASVELDELSKPQWRMSDAMKQKALDSLAAVNGSDKVFFFSDRDGAHARYDRITIELGADSTNVHFSYRGEEYVCLASPGSKPLDIGDTISVDGLNGVLDIKLE